MSVSGQQARHKTAPHKTKIRNIAWLAGLAALAACGFLLRERILWDLGQVLVTAEEPRKADIVVVVGGDWHGNRILRGAELVRQGFAPRVLVSGGAGFYGRFESDVAVDFAVKNGAPREIFVVSREVVSSTGEEAQSDAAILRRMGVHSYLLVTSEFHTARARREFRRAAPDLEVRAITASDPHWNKGYWWRTREGRKTWLLEAAKSFAGLLRI